MNRSSFTLKALTAALILASASGAVFAKGYKGDFKGEACPPPQMLMTGWYLGAQVGYDAYRVRNSVSVPAGAATLVTNPTIAANGWVGGLMLGYGMMMNEWFYLGGEVFADISNADQNFSATAGGSTYTNKFEVDSSYGLGLLPGIKMTDSTLTYVRLGWNWANLKTNETLTGAASSSKSNTSNGFVFGVGMETLIVDNWSLRGEWDHTWYSSYNTGGVYGTSVNPSNNEYMLGLIYHFG
ncbi:MAG TPA: outer membrane beta-barrel protein [Gammaproteobacteria bacterium]|jgi:outer membrane immunogenic protein|nr:outer membrane beta-barrel protein [Gammaproteobacteria bacterium]